MLMRFIMFRFIQVVMSSLSFLYLSTSAAACASLNCLFSLWICAAFFAMLVFFLRIYWCKYFFVVYCENINLSRRSLILDIYLSLSSFLAFDRLASLCFISCFLGVIGCLEVDMINISCARRNGHDSTLVMVVSEPVTISLDSHEESGIADVELDVNAPTEEAVAMMKSSWQKEKNFS